MLRTALVVVVVFAAAACGGKSKPAAVTGTGTSEPAARPTYCQDFSTCAEERERMDRDFGGDELTPEQQSELAAGVEARLDSCSSTYNGLTPHQQQWLESCTGCGGSCDVYDCLDQAGSIAEDVNFECDMGDDGGGDEGMSGED